MAALDNCSTRVNGALFSAGFIDPSNPASSLLSSLGIPSSAPLPMTSMPESAATIANFYGAVSVALLVGTPASSPIYNDPLLQTFEPK